MPVALIASLGRRDLDATVLSDFLLSTLLDAAGVSAAILRISKL
jgi:hypothetical protein